ncbi:hypothetical protein KUV89_04385 [Marinobacter hydrocarbonoclasticus]|nr:hypothetical protein [Marinobacter nauticus]
MAKQRGRVASFGNTEAAQLLKIIRERGDLDVATLADLLMTTPESVRRWQRGQVNAKGTQLAVLRAIASAQKTDWDNVRLLAAYNRDHPEPMEGTVAVETLSEFTKTLRK